MSTLQSQRLTEEGARGIEHLPLQVNLLSDVGEGGILVYILWRACVLYDIASGHDGKVIVIVLGNYFSCRLIEIYA
jgi:hypothetical protein